MRYISIVEYDEVNSDDFSITLFCTHCEHKCKGCYSPCTWNAEAGEELTREIKNDILNKLETEIMIGNFVFLGGDPLSKLNRNETIEFAKEIKEKVPRINIWVYTGYDMDEIQDLDLSYFDYIKCGRYKEELSCKGNVQYGIKLATSNQKIYKLK